MCLALRMPTVLISGPYRFFFYSDDRDEPVHIHVEREKSKAKFWLDPVRLTYSKGFSQAEIHRIEMLIVANRGLLLRKWNEHFD
jgi:hypothetical protein